MFIILHWEDLLSFEIRGSGLCLMNLCHWASQHVLVDEQEVGIFAYADAATFLLKEHLPGNIDSQGGECLLAGEAFFRPPGFGLLGIINTRDYNLHDAERIAGAPQSAGKSECEDKLIPWSKKDFIG